INRLVNPSEGEIIFDGQHLENLNGRKLRKERSKIGMIFQHYNLVGRTNVIKNVLHGQLSNIPLYKSLLGLYRHEDKQEAVD
ncbi:ATP-binding cassette domain-containing protein, partial [Bacillus sp. GbtcB15]